MFQSQYLNSRLNNKHINSILDNYKLKYSGIKIEIESKVNEMIKLFLKDVLGFLENVEEIAIKKKKLNNYEKMKNELDSIKSQLKIKTYNEHKTKNELDLLMQENSLLKVKIKSLNQKIKNLNYNINNSVNERNAKTPFIRNLHKSNKSISNDLRSSCLLNSNNSVINFVNKKHSYSVNKKIKSDKNLPVINNLSSIMNKPEKQNQKQLNIFTERNKTNTLNEYIKKSNLVNSTKNKKSKKVNYNKFVNNKRSNNNINITKITNISNNIKDSNCQSKENLIEIKKDDEQTFTRPILKTMNAMVRNQKNGGRNSSSSSSTPRESDLHKYSPNNSFDLLPKLNPDYEEIGNNINNVFDEELKQLEQDEENIKSILEQLKNRKYNGITLVNKSIDNKFENKN